LDGEVFLHECGAGALLRGRWTARRTDRDGVRADRPRARAGGGPAPPGGTDGDTHPGHADKSGAAGAVRAQEAVVRAAAPTAARTDGERARPRSVAHHARTLQGSLRRSLVLHLT